MRIPSANDGPRHIPCTTPAPWHTGLQPGTALERKTPHGDAPDTEAMMLARAAALSASSLHEPCAVPADRMLEFEERALVHLDALYRTALRLTRNRAEAEDVVQDTCLRAFRKIPPIQARHQLPGVDIHDSATYLLEPRPAIRSRGAGR